MSKPPRIALVNPYFRTRAATELLFPPLGLAALEAQLRNRRLETQIFDCTFQTMGQLEMSLRSFQPDILGITSIVTLVNNTFNIARLVRDILPECLLVAGGAMPTLYPERFSQHLDAVFCGEADLNFPQFCQDYLVHHLNREKLGELPLEMYKGLYIKQNHLETINPIVHHSESEIQSFPIIDRSDFNHSAYQEVWDIKFGKKTTSLITTLGCPFNCDFCSRPVFGNLFRRRNLDTIILEIDQIQKLGYDNLWIADDNFTLSLPFLTNFCQRIAQRKLGWSCLSRSTGVSNTMAQMMKEAGCQRVYLGLETGSENTLKVMNKQATLEEGINAVLLFHRAGIEVAGFFIVGYPGETRADIEETFKISLNLPLDEISFNVPYPLPGSKLFERVVDLDSEKDWKEENEITFIYKSEFNPDWLRQRINETMQAFALKKRS